MWERESERERERERERESKRVSEREREREGERTKDIDLIEFRRGWEFLNSEMSGNP